MIDVKTLHIGAHIKVDGEIQRVCSIDNDGIGVDVPITYKVACGSSIISEESIYEQSYSAEDVTPIPLTAELLQELGFELTVYWGVYKIYSKDNIMVRFIGERIHVKVSPNLAAISSIKYLHELENFIYLTIGKELVE